MLPKMKFIVFLAFTILISCTKKQITENTDNITQKSKTSKIEKSIIKTAHIDSLDTEILETFVDSLNIGDKGKCKVELIKYRVYKDNYVIIKFYTKGKNSIKDPETWMIQNNYSYETNSIMRFETNISDFNNDRFNDITFISGTAARGSNEVRRLFIYDSEKQKLVSIMNSEEYPNMLYNSELDCIDAFLVHGGCSTVFLNIEGDSLRMFARVELDEALTVSTYNKKGLEKIIFKDTKSQESYARYKNFKPLKKYDEY